MVLLAILREKNKLNRPSLGASVGLLRARERGHGGRSCSLLAERTTIWSATWQGMLLRIASFQFRAHLAAWLASTMRRGAQALESHHEKKARRAQRRADHVNVCVMCHMPCLRPGDCVEISNAVTE